MASRGPLGLLERQRHAERPHAVLPRCVADHGAPAAPHVEQALSRAEVELAADQVELRRLRLLERRVRGLVERAGVGHRRAEHQLVEAVGDVVVVGDHLGVAHHRVPQALDRAAPARQVLLRRRRGHAQAREPEAPRDQQRVRRRRHAEPGVVLEQHQRVVGVARMHPGQVQVAADVGPGHAEVAGRGHQVGEATLGAQVQAERRVGRSGGAAVVRREAHRQTSPHQAVHRLGDGDPCGGAGLRGRVGAHRRCTTLS